MVTKNMHIVTTIYCRYCIFLLYRYNVYLLQTEIIIVHLFIGTSPTIYYILTDRVAPGSIFGCFGPDHDPCNMHNNNII